VKKSIVGIAIGLLLTLSVSAWALEIQGKVQQVDMAERTFTLEDGTKIWVAAEVSIEQLKEGKTVKASYEERDGNKVATSLEVSE
jgi:hypothetical protein